jgi:hypothetical protein
MIPLKNLVGIRQINILKKMRELHNENPEWKKGLSLIQEKYPEFFIEKNIEDYLLIAYEPFEIIVRSMEPIMPQNIKNEISELAKLHHPGK